MRGGDTMIDVGRLTNEQAKRLMRDLIPCLTQAELEDALRECLSADELEDLKIGL
jgi:polyhydroxyalkanoate synthesis regulator phasin